MTSLVRSYAALMKKKKNDDEAPQKTTISAKKAQPSDLPYYISLTDVGRRFPTLFQPSKIQVVNRMVNVIDLVPQQFRHADTIYLTNNRLSNTVNIDQFTNLQT